MSTPDDGTLINNDTAKRIVSGLCIIDVTDQCVGHGFFGSITSDSLTLYGLFTNSHLVGQERLRSGDPVTCVISNDVTVQLPLDAYRFRCKLLDVTFIQVDSDKKEEIERAGSSFLPIAAEKSLVAHETKILSAKRGDGDSYSIGIDVMAELWGCDMLHGKSTDKWLPGSPVTLESGEVVGIHTQKCETGNRCLAARMFYVSAAILKDVARVASGESIPPTSTSNLTATHVEELNQLGLQVLGDRDRLLVSPESFAVTPIWFRRTSHAWFWTPTDPEERRANWMRISPDDDLKVIGGYWNGIEPAPKNIRIIRHLQSNGERYLA